MDMSDDTAIVFHGFLNLPNLEKLKLVEAINEYFDSDDRDPIRAANELRLKETNFTDARTCKCCGR